MFLGWERVLLPTDIALLFCDAVIKSKLPMPPQYPHRACVYFTKLMQTLVAAHHDSVAHAMDIKSTLQGTAKSVSWTHALRPEHVHSFLSMEPLQLQSLQPIDVVLPDHVVDAPVRAAIRHAFMQHPDALLIPNTSKSPVERPNSSSRTSKTVVYQDHSTRNPHDPSTTWATSPLLCPLQVSPAKGPPVVHFDPNTSTSRDIRVAMRAHNLGLLPDSSAKKNRLFEWEYGVEPFTPRLDARQLTRGLSLPALPLAISSAVDAQHTTTLTPSHGRSLLPTTSTSSTSSSTEANDQFDNNGHHHVNDDNITPSTDDLPLTLLKLDCLVGAETFKQDHHSLLSSMHSSLPSPCDAMGTTTTTIPKLNRNMVTSTRKCCALCTRPFPVVNLVGVVLMKRILELRATWGLATAGTPKCAPASYLYRDVRVCVLCTDILYGQPDFRLNSQAPPSTTLSLSSSSPSISPSSLLPLHPLPTSSSSIQHTASISKHVQHLRRLSLSAHTYSTTTTPTATTVTPPPGFDKDILRQPQPLTNSTTNYVVDEVGYMIHQRILNDALLLRAPSQVLPCVDLTQRRHRGVVASQSSVLMLGVASNAINPVDTHRGIHTHEEQAPWWEVDLGSHCEISTVEVWNCADSDPQVAARLFPCHILLLLKPGHRRPLVELLGVAVDSVVLAAPSQPLRWRPKTGSVCRYVRLVVDKLTYLHVERVHVFGTALKHDDLVPTTNPLRPATASTAAAKSTTLPSSPASNLRRGQRHHTPDNHPNLPHHSIQPPFNHISMRFQQDRRHSSTSSTSGSPHRPKSAGFLLPTASSHMRDQLTHALRDQLAIDDQVNHPLMHSPHYRQHHRLPPSSTSSPCQ
ncbi:hypothetical protein, variant [Aphanomyces astaci]|uniref:Fucolectin tachylectin-4 pentraxin-1 domain-containing protein n=1 Tax=Aphanomyces astaci TaxID=112090 RepID=W4G1Y8_APHAT|nr:hypothetical protein, variant [Aphanomyces astaci]ETV73296.1 hypothetical protein, variant [Aphanomyces astaci]|eukprot:XP_009837170.1 hypothetical protein, variant [Aphanomyces astaci]